MVEAECRSPGSIVQLLTPKDSLSTRTTHSSNASSAQILWMALITESEDGIFIGYHEVRYLPKYQDWRGESTNYGALSVVLPIPKWNKERRTRVVWKVRNSDKMSEEATLLCLHRSFAWSHWTMHRICDILVLIFQLLCLWCLTQDLGGLLRYHGRDHTQVLPSREAGMKISL